MPLSLQFSLLTFVSIMLLGCAPQKEDIQPVKPLTTSLTQAILFKSPQDIESIESKASLDQVYQAISTLKQNHHNDTNVSVAVTIPGDTPWSLGIHSPSPTSPSPNRASHTTYPLIIYLHGGVNTTRTDKGHDAYTMFSFLYDSIPCFVASPSANRTARWWEPKGIERILFTVRYMTLLYPIDTENIILAGVSDGGTATFALASLSHAPFTDYWAISGFPPLLANRGVQLNIDNLKKTSFFMANGGNDHLYPTQQVQAFVSQAQELGIIIDFSFHPKAEHGFDYKLQELTTLRERLTPVRKNTTSSFRTQNTKELLSSILRANKVPPLP